VTVSLVGLPEPADGLLLTRLEAAVRAEFRIDVYWPEPDDPVLGGACTVADCRGVPRARGLCNAHHRRWLNQGRPHLAEFVADAAPRRLRGTTPSQADCFVLSAVGGQLRLELAYALQCRHDERTGRLNGHVFARVARVVGASRCESLLDVPVDEWVGEAFGSPRTAIECHAWLRYAYRVLEDLAVGSDPEALYACDVWDARRLGLPEHADSRLRLRFDAITPGWLRDAAKRWARFRLAGGKAWSTVRTDIDALASFSRFLIAHRLELTHPSSITRPLLEDYLSWLAHTTVKVPTRRGRIGGLCTFLEHGRRYGWLPGLPASATIYREDYPPVDEAVPRFVPEFVMTQLEATANLERLDDLTIRHLTIVLIETGLRITDACRLPFNPIIDDSVGWPCLRYYNHKMRAEQLIPLSARAAETVRDQQAHVRARWPAGSAWLFPRHRANPDATHPVGATSVRRRLAAWQHDIDLRDEAGQPVRATPHQFRHTVGTRMINQGVPQHVIQKLLGHASPKMTARYAHIHDTTVRAAFDDYQARRVDIHGRRLDFDPEASTSEAEWVKHNLARVAATLPNGYCGRPPQQDCPHPNACLTCPDFQTTPQFLAIHRRQRDGTLEILDAAEQAGNARLADNHRQVATNLERIIETLETIDEQDTTDAAG
jgi:integrase